MQTQNPTDAELKVLKCLWAHTRLSAREIHEATVAETEWSFSTTRKLIERLVAKDLAIREPVHGMNTYRPGRGKLHVMAGLIRTFAQNILDTDGPIPVATFVQSRLIDDSEIEELEALVNGSEAEQ